MTSTVYVAVQTFTSHPSLVLPTDAITNTSVTNNPKLAACYVPLISHGIHQVCIAPVVPPNHSQSHRCLSPKHSRDPFDVKFLSAKKLNSGAVHRLVFTISAAGCSADQSWLGVKRKYMQRSMEIKNT